MSESEFDPVYRELVRIFGAAPTVAEGAKAFTFLPLVSEQDAVEFFRTVPTGTPFEELPRLAAAYRASHPTSAIDLDNEDREAAG